MDNDILKMARESGIERDDDFAFDESDSGVIYYIHPGTLERFYALAVAAEREACAQLAFELGGNRCDVVADAIRARSKA